MLKPSARRDNKRLKLRFCLPTGPVIFQRSLQERIQLGESFRAEVDKGEEGLLVRRTQLVFFLRGQISLRPCVSLTNRNSFMRNSRQLSAHGPRNVINQLEGPSPNTRWNVRRYV